MDPTRGLILRSNRYLGTALVDSGLVSGSDLETANDHFLPTLHDNQVRHPSLLHILLYDVQALPEEDLLSYQIEQAKIGLLDIRHYDPNVPAAVNLDACWATWTLPYDCEDRFIFFASAYFLSPPVREYWEKQFPDFVPVWHAAPLIDLQGALENREAGGASGGAGA
ncbi:MAG: hypothetical protein ACFE0O_02035 [Opitutales bacterium]